MPLVRNLLVLLVFIFSITSCNNTEPKHQNKTVFRYNESFGISTLDPAFAKDQSIIWAVNHIFNGLVQMDEKLQIQPSIAKSWDISKDGLQYTFHLRNDVYFHDDKLFNNGKGRKVTAADFSYSLKRLVDPQTASPGAWIFGNVKTTGKDYAFNTINDSTFQIELNKPFPPFLGLLTMQYCSVVPKEVIAFYGKDFRTHPIGTGPFIFKFWKEGVKLILHKNPHYFEIENGKQLPYIDAVAVSFINDRQSAFLQFLQGKLDMINSLDASFKDELLTHAGTLQPKYKGKFKIETMPYLNTEYLGILADEKSEIMKHSPLRFKEVRQAINYAFDRKKMITYLRNNIATSITSGIVPAGLPSYSASLVKGYDYNPEKAKQLLKKAGYAEGKNMPVITLSTTSSYADLCEYMQGQLAEVGIKSKIEVNQSATHREMVAKQQLAFFRGSWIADYPDAENYLALFYSKNFAPNGPNNTHFKNKKYDELYEKALSEIDTSKRYQYYRDMDNIVVDEAPVVILYYDKVLRLHQNNINGIYGNAMNLLTLKTAQIN
jgi:oligopeptide transport system substrate-binding protein